MSSEEVGKHTSSTSENDTKNKQVPNRFSLFLTSRKKALKEFLNSRMKVIKEELGKFRTEPKDYTVNHLQRNKKFYLVYCSIILIYLIGSGLITIFLSPYSSLVTRLLLFIIGLLPIAILVRWDKNSRVVLVSLLLFNLLTLSHAIWFPRYYSILTPVFPIFYSYRSFFPFIAQYNKTGQLLLNIARYGYLVDLAIVMVLAGLISVSSKLFNQIVIYKGRGRILRILIIIFTLTTLIVLPYLVIMFTGVMHFGLAYSSGAIQLQQGIDTAVSQDFGNAREYFVEAVTQYDLAEDLYNGLQKLGMNELLLTLDPELEGLLSNGDKLIESSFRIANVFLPLIDGILLLEDSFDTILTLGIDQNVVQLTSILLENAREKFEQAQIPLAIALKLLNLVDIPGFAEALRDQGVGDYLKELQLVTQSGLLLNATLDVGLIQLLPLDSFSFPMYHVMQSIFATRTVQDQIGNQTRYSNVISTFRNLNSNLSVVKSSLDPKRFGEYSKLNNLQLKGSKELIALRTKIVGLFNFLRDLVTIGLKMGEFGIATAGILQEINSTLKPMVSDLMNIPNIPDQVLYEAINTLDLLRQNSTVIQQLAGEIELSAAQMEENVKLGKYGLFSKQATLVVNLLHSFQLQRNADNFYHLSSSCYYLLLGIVDFQLVGDYANDIEGNISRIEEQPSDQTTVNSAVNSINQSLELVNSSILKIQANLTLMEYHINQIENMPEVDQLNMVLDVMRDRINKILDGSLRQIRLALGQIQIPVNSETTDQVRDEIKLMRDFLADIDTAIGELNIEYEE